MVRWDRLSGLFWLLFSFAVLFEASRLGVGSLREPGSGFLLFGAASALGILSLILCIRASIGKKGRGMEHVSMGPGWTRVLLVTSSLFLYARLMPVLGFLIATFLLLTILYLVSERRRVRFALVASAVTTLASYIIFSKWMNSQFPDGLFGF